MLHDFKQFIMRGNVVDLAVGVIIGAAFGKITTSLVNDILMPPLGLVVGKIDFSNYFIPLTLTNPGNYTTIAQAQAAGVTTLNIGMFANVMIQFLIVSFAVFLFIVKPINKLKKREEAKTAAEVTAVPPAPPRQELLLEEIRDLLKQQQRPS